MSYAIILNGQSEDQYIKVLFNIDEVNKLKENSALLDDLFNSLENNECIDLDISNIKILNISTKVALQFLLELLRPSKSKLVWDIEFAVLSSYFGVPSYVNKYSVIIRNCFGPPYHKIKDEDFIEMLNITANIIEYALPSELLTSTAKYDTLRKQNKLTVDIINKYLTKEELVTILIESKDHFKYVHSSIDSGTMDIHNEEGDDEDGDY